MIEGGSVATQDRKLLAAYYTPGSVAQVLMDWALADVTARVLDPSFGGCAFLYAGVETLQRRGHPFPGRQIYGVDIDPEAQKYLDPLFKAGATPDQFAVGDFFDISPDYFDEVLFDAVVGNPPYVRYHSIPRQAQARAVSRLEGFNVHISGRASYWALFLLYAMQFLRRGGRLAMVLPGAFLHTDYAAQVRSQLVRHFERVTILLLEERIFDGTDEESVLVLASGARLPHKELRIGTVARVETLSSAVENELVSTSIIRDQKGDGELLRALLDPPSVALYDKLTESDTVVRLGDWVKVRIGVVTGSNDYFILSPAEQEKRGIPSRYFVPIIRRPASLQGISVTDEHLRSIAARDDKSLLLVADRVESNLPLELREYLRHGFEQGIPQAQKCRARIPWYVVPHIFAPGAFMQCMSASWPRLVVNRSSYTCTNNILRLDWKQSRRAEDWDRLAIGALSTLSQLSAELVGRSYGGGVLKVEPTELVGLAVPLLPADVVALLASEVDTLLRQNRFLEATRRVDLACQRCLPDFTVENTEQLRQARNALFLRRRQHRRDVQKHLDE